MSEPTPTSAGIRSWPNCQFCDQISTLHIETFEQGKTVNIHLCEKHAHKFMLGNEMSDDESGELGRPP